MRRATWGHVAIALVLPLGVCLGLVPFREQVANTDFALVLVLIIAAVAAVASRGSGILAALSAAIWFDFLLTRPYEQLTIFASQDIRTTVLLLLVGVAVTETAQWGRRQQARAGRQTGYLESLQYAAHAVTDRQVSRAALVDDACRQIVALLGATACRFDTSPESSHPSLNADGTVIWGDLVWDVDRVGLPVQTETAISASSGGRSLGRFLVSAAPDTRPSIAQRTLAVTLINLVSLALAGGGSEAPLPPTSTSHPTSTRPGGSGSPTATEPRRTGQTTRWR